MVGLEVEVVMMTEHPTVFALLSPVIRWSTPVCPRLTVMQTPQRGRRLGSPFLLVRWPRLVRVTTALTVTVAPLAVWLLTTSLCRLWLTGTTVLTGRTFARMGMEMDRWETTLEVTPLIGQHVLVLTGFPLLTGLFSAPIIWFSREWFMGMERRCLEYPIALFLPNPELLFRTMVLILRLLRPTVSFTILLGNLTTLPSTMLSNFLTPVMLLFME